MLVEKSLQAQVAAQGSGMYLSVYIWLFGRLLFLHHMSPRWLEPTYVTKYLTCWSANKYLFSQLSIRGSAGASGPGDVLASIICAKTSMSTLVTSCTLQGRWRDALQSNTQAPLVSCPCSSTSQYTCSSTSGLRVGHAVHLQTSLT
jgi:hypothetical protein